MDDLLRRFARSHPWPAERPEVPEDWHGWLCVETAAALTSHLGPETRLVVELGTWLGFSARAILQHAPAAVLICVDHWRGSPEHQPETGNLDWSRRLPTLYETFLRNLWPWKDGLVPVRADTLLGLAEIAAAGLEPDLVYVDSEHTPDRVGRELAFITSHWPRATVVGDDFDNPAVSTPAIEHAAKTGRILVNLGAAFVLPPLVPSP